MLQGKTALVTGSTSGIGLGVALSLARQGAHVVLNGFGEAQAIETVRSGLAAKYGVSVRYSAADMTKPQEIAAMIASHLAAGKSSTLATCWMPALLTRMSTAPNSPAA